MACNKAKATADTELEVCKKKHSTADGTEACNNANSIGDGRGGARRKSIIPVNQDALDRVFETAVELYKQKAFDLGDYNHLKTTQAASSPGLQQCQWWLKNLLPLRTGAILPLQLRSSLLKHCETHNDSDYKHDLWATKKASQFGVLFNHCRRLKYDSERVTQLKKKATPRKHKVMDELLALEPGVCPGEAWNKASSTENMDQDKSQDMPAEVCNKAEEETLSEISLDSHGFRNMLRSPDRSKNKASGSKSGLKQSPAKKQELLSKKGKSHRETLELQAANAAEKLAVATPKKP